MSILKWFLPKSRKNLSQYWKHRLGNTTIVSLPIMTDSSIPVTSLSSLQSSTIQACLRVICEDMSGLPWFTLRRDGRSRTKAPEHPTYRLLHSAPNPQMTAFNWRYQTLGNLLLEGESFHYIQKRNARPIALWPLNPNRVTRERRNGELVYIVTTPDGKKEYPQDSILDFVGMTLDGIRGMSVIRYAANVVGTTLAADKLAAKLFSSGNMMGGYLKHPGKLSPEAEDNLKESFVGVTAGVDNAHHTPVLDEGMEYVSMGIKADEMQFVESRRYNGEECCRLFRVSPPLAGILDRATFNNVEQLYIAHVRQTLRPWAIRLEQEVQRKLFWEDEQEEFYNEMNFEGMLRGDQKTRYESYAIGKQWGFLNTNRILEYENESAIEGGDDYLTPLNMVPMQTESGFKYAPTAWKIKEPIVKDTKLLQVELNTEPLIIDAVSRLRRKELNAVKRAWKKYQEPETFMVWAKEFYEGHQKHAIDIFVPIEESTGKKLDIADDLILSSMRDLELAMSTPDPDIEMGKVLTRWEECCKKN